MNTPQTPQPNTQYFNPADGKTYTMKQQDPSGKGTVMVDTQTQEEQLLPNPSMQEVQMNNGQQTLKPIMKTQTLGVTMAHDIDRMVNGEPMEDQTGVSGVSDAGVSPVVDDPFKSDIDAAIDQIDLESQGVDGDIDDIMRDAHPFHGVESPSTGVDGLAIRDGGPPAGSMPPEDARLTPGHPYMASTVAPLKVESTSKRWSAIRAGLTTKGLQSFKERQFIHLKNAGLSHRAKDLGFSPDSREPEPSGHSDHGVPISGPPAEKNMEIGLTEFPKDQDRDASVGLDTDKGYNISMKEMDEKQVADREKFDNEHRQYMGAMTIRQLRALFKGNNDKEVVGIEKGRGLQPERQPVKPDVDDLYAVEKKAIALAVGLRSTAMELAPPEPAPEGPIPKDAPVVHKPSQKAPSLEQYHEPGVVPAASKMLKILLNKFMRHYQTLEELNSQLRDIVAPYQKSIVEERAKMMPAITEEAKGVQETAEMLYTEISKTEDGIVHYVDEIWAVVSRDKVISPAVTVPQIIAALDLSDKHMADKVRELARVLSEHGESRLRERFIYEFPPSKSLEKRMTPESSLSSTAAISLDELKELVKGFMFINSEIEDALNMFGGMNEAQ
jgi:hypothetical protein